MRIGGITSSTGGVSMAPKTRTHEKTKPTVDDRGLFLLQCGCPAERDLRLLRREVLHEVGQRLATFDRHGVVDARADAADGAVALEADHLLLSRRLHELVGQLVA